MLASHILENTSKEGIQFLIHSVVILSSKEEKHLMIFVYKHLIYAKLVSKCMQVLQSPNKLKTELVNTVKLIITDVTTIGWLEKN